MSLDDDDRVRSRGRTQAARIDEAEARGRTARVPGKQSGTSHLPHGSNGPYVAEAAGTPAPADFDLYLAKHEVDINQIVLEHLAETAWPDPAPDVPWVGVGHRMFAHSLSLLIRPQLRDGDRVQALVYPGDVLARFYRYAGEPGKHMWSPAFVTSFAQLVERAAVLSLTRRIGPQYRAALARKASLPSADDLTSRHAIDRFVALALTRGHVVDTGNVAVGDPAPESTQGSGKAKGRGKDPKPDAQVETAPSIAQVWDVERKIVGLLDRLGNQVTMYGLTSQLKPAYDARMERLALLANADEATRTRFVPVLQFQHGQLLSIDRKLKPLVAQLRPIFLLPNHLIDAGKRHRKDRLLSAISTCVRAAALSDRPDESNALLANIVAIEGDNTLDRLDAAQVETTDATRQAISSGVRASTDTAEGEEEITRQRQAVLNHTERGGSAYEEKKALTLAGEAALHNRILAVRESLRQLAAAASRAGFSDPKTFRAHFPNIKTVPVLIDDVSRRLDKVEHTRRTTATQSSNLVLEAGAPSDWNVWIGRAVGLAVAQEAFGKLAGDRSINEFIETTRDAIEDEIFWNAVTKFAATLVLTLALGAGAAMLGDSANTAITAWRAGRIARTAALVADVSINVTINSAVQVALADGPASPGWTALTNVLMEVFTRLTMLPLRRAQTAASAEYHALAQLPHLSKLERNALLSVSHFSSVELTVAGVGGMATQWAADRLVTLVRPEGAQGEAASDDLAMTVLQQGASIGLGKFFHSRFKAWQEHRAALMRTKLGTLPEAKALFSAREQFYKEAKQLSESLSPDPAAGDRLVEQDVALLKQERELLVKHGGDDTQAPPEPTSKFDAAEDHQRAVKPPPQNDREHPRRTGIRVSKDQVSEPVPGLFDSIEANETPAGWIVDDGPGVHPHPDHPEWLQIETRVTAPDGSSGWIERSYDPTTKTLVMENAFLKNLPRWINAGKALRTGSGTPTVTYLTLRQMKILDAKFGETRLVKMSTIQNIEAVMQLEHMRRQGVPYEQAVSKTHSVSYATTSIQQSGQMIVDMRIDMTGAFEWRLADMMDHFRMGHAERSELCKKYNLTTNDVVQVNYDIYIQVAPFKK